MYVNKIILSLLCVSYQIFGAAAARQDIIKAQEKASVCDTLKDILPVASIQQLVADYVNSYEVISSYDNKPCNFTQMALSANGKIIAFTTSEPKLFVLELKGSEFQLIYEKELENGAFALAISPDGRSIGIVSLANYMDYYVYKNNMYVKEKSINLGCFNPKNIYFFERNNVTYLVSMDLMEYVSIRKQKNDFSFEEIQTLIVPGNHHKGALSKNGDVLAVSNDKHEIYIYQLNQETQQFNDKPVFFQKFDNIKNFALSYQGEYLATCDGKSVRVWGLKANQLVLIDTIMCASIDQIALSPDGARLCIVFLDDRDALYDTWKISIWKKNKAHKFELFQTIISKASNPPFLAPFIPDASYLVGGYILNKGMNMIPKNLYLFRNYGIA